MISWKKLWIISITVGLLLEQTGLWCNVITPDYSKLGTIKSKNIIQNLGEGTTSHIVLSKDIDDDFWREHLGEDFKTAIFVDLSADNGHMNSQLSTTTTNATEKKVFKPISNINQDATKQIDVNKEKNPTPEVTISKEEINQINNKKQKTQETDFPVEVSVLKNDVKKDVDSQGTVNNSKTNSIGKSETYKEAKEEKKAEHQQPKLKKNTNLNQKPEHNEQIKLLNPKLTSTQSLPKSMESKLQQKNKCKICMPKITSSIGDTKTLNNKLFK